MESLKIAVTGGAGFIGSGLVERLVDEGHEVVVVDNLSTGKKSRVPSGAEFRNVDLSRDFDPGFLEGVDRVYHLAANADVKAQNDDRDLDFLNGFKATKNLLEAMESQGVNDLVFTSSSTVYGEEVPTPTPESYGPLEPISLYGSYKLASESLISTYSHSFGFSSTVLRLANIVSGDMEKGVVYDFVEKLREGPSSLEVLGDGRQEKSYLSLEECIDAMLQAARGREERYEVYNVGSRDTVSVERIAEIVVEGYGSDTEITYTGGRRGWKGDVPRMLLDVSKIRERIGWNPEKLSEETVEQAAKEMTG